MSGPKVVRVVTREEAIAECQAHLDRLQSAIDLWKQEGQKANVLDEQDIKVVMARYDDYVMRLAKDEFRTVSANVPKEIEFLKGDIPRRQEHAVELAVARQAQRRKIPANAEALLKALQSKSPPVPTQLLDALAKVRDGRSNDEEADRALSEGLKLLSDSVPAEGLSAEQAGLVALLRQDNVAESLSTWRAPKVSDDVREQSLENIFQTIANLGSDAVVKGLRERYAQLDNERDIRRKSMLIDSVLIDASQMLQQLKDANARRFDLTLVLRELETMEPEQVRELKIAIEQALANPHAVDVPVLLDRARESIRLYQHQRAALLRRQAVLQGLSALGYEVREGMETAWVASGRVTLKSLNNPGYGVEVAGAPESDRMQVRVVAYASPARDPARDKDAESIWCGDFKRLQSKLAESGSELTLLKALDVGAQAVRIVESDVVSDETTVVTSTQPSHINRNS